MARPEVRVKATRSMQDRERFDGRVCMVLGPYSQRAPWVRVSDFFVAVEDERA